jgi:hypothetical protein
VGQNVAADIHVTRSGAGADVAAGSIVCDDAWLAESVRLRLSHHASSSGLSA